MEPEIAVVHPCLACRMASHRGRWLLAVLLVACFAVPFTAAGDPPKPPSPVRSITFRDFSAVNMAEDTSRSLYRGAVGMNRLELLWNHLEPISGQWDQQRLKAYGDLVLRQNQNRVGMLVLLAYATDWSAAPHPQVRIGSHPAYISRQHVADWVRYVDRVVSFLRQPPYNVLYFQVWNEPWKHPQCGFWGGSDDQFFEHVYLPAAECIRKRGGRVVYGGWPSCEDLSTWVALMNKHQAWDDTDVLSFHYQSGWNSVWAWPRMRSAASQAGFPRIKIWTTEVGSIVDPGWFANWYTKLFYWAVTNGGERDPDLVKAFYFKEEGGRPGDYHFDKSLYLGKRLTPRGQALQVLADLFSGGAIRGYSAVENDRGLSPQIAPFGHVASAVESFFIDSQPPRIVTGFQLREEEFTADSSIRLEFPEVRRAARAERVDIAGHVTSLPILRSDRGIASTVTVRNARGSRVQNWNVGDVTPFFMVLTLAP